MPRRSDISLKSYAKFLTRLLMSKIKNSFLFNKKKMNNCAIIFPPALGLGDLVILSRIIDIVQQSEIYDQIKVFSSAPWIDNKRIGVDYYDLSEVDKLVNTNLFIFPTYTLLNSLIAKILNKKNCIGYINFKPFFLENKSKFYIDKKRPYYERLKPFKMVFNSKLDLKPVIWKNEILKKRELRHNYVSFDQLKEFINHENYVISLSTYNFYKKFRPNINLLKKLLIKKIKKVNLNTTLVIIGSDAKPEVEYNNFIFNELEGICNQTFNSSGLFTIDQTIDILSQSNFYFGANNGISNIVQIIGLDSEQIFVGPERPIIRKFSQKSSIRYYK